MKDRIENVVAMENVEGSGKKEEEVIN